MSSVDIFRWKSDIFGTCLCSAEGEILAEKLCFLILFITGLSDYRLDMTTSDNFYCPQNRSIFISLIERLCKQRVIEPVMFGKYMFHAYGAHTGITGVALFESIESILISLQNKRHLF